MKKIAVVILILMMSAVVSGCGIKGPPKPPPDPETALLQK